jgi:hypothetical protein
VSIEFRQLRYAVMTADKRSSARATKALGAEQPTLSKKMANLEIRIGVKLHPRSAERRGIPAPDLRARPANEASTSMTFGIESNSLQQQRNTLTDAHTHCGKSVSPFNAG